jgi:hypothetical protein
LTNALATFQSLMNDIFRPLLCRYVLVFFGNILVYSRSFKDHLKYLHKVLKLLEVNSLKVKMSKCLWSERKVEYLWHVISTEDVAADQSKMKSMTDLPIQRTVRKLHVFLGLTSYYRRFVAGYGKIAALLTVLLRKDSFVWSDKQRRPLKN